MATTEEVLNSYVGIVQLPFNMDGRIAWTGYLTEGGHGTILFAPTKEAIESQALQILRDRGVVA